LMVFIVYIKKFYSIFKLLKIEFHRMKYLFFKDDPIFENCFFIGAQKDVINVKYSDLFSESLNYDIYSDITKFIDIHKIDSTFIFRKYINGYDTLEALKLNLDFLGVNIFEYYINKMSKDSLAKNVQDDIDFSDANNILVISDMLVGNNLQFASDILDKTYKTYKTFFDNE